MQVSLGAVVDGYPLLSGLDPNDDGRFTIRELRRLEERLRSFDRNADGQLTLSETRSPIRICVGLGPTVHRELASVRSNRTTEPYSVAGPEWFIRMDRNGDNDLSRNEFPGTNEQFAALDIDHDDLISAAEATHSDKTTKKAN
jgi:Ca2+-binding EF-hand superfamily protein